LVHPAWNENLPQPAALVGNACIFLVAAYFSLVFHGLRGAGWHHSKSKHRSWLGTVMINTPAYSPILLLLLFAWLHITSSRKFFDLSRLPS